MSTSASVTLVLVFLTVGFGIAAYHYDQERIEISHRRDSLGIAFGCDEEFPIPVTNKDSKPVCIQRFSCSLWGPRPTCDRHTPNPKWSLMWERLEAQRNDSETRQLVFTAIAVLLGYLVVGWYAHSLILALMLRFMLLKWALLATLAADALCMNAVGLVRAIVGLLKLPRHGDDGAKPPIK